MKRNWYIPMNFMETGYVLNGAVPIRNAVEACILCLIGISFCRVLPLPSGTDALPYYILIAGPLGLIGLCGAGGDALSTFLIDVVKWRRRRKPYLYNDHGLAYTQEAAEALMNAPQFRDTIAGMVDKMRAGLASKEIDYIEGQTFVFADDPEQVALREAQAEIDQKREEERLAAEERARAEEETAKIDPFAQYEKTVNAKQVTESMVLEDLEFDREEDVE